MDWYLTVKVVHIISSTVLFGTGLGIAFFMFRSHFSEPVQEKYYAVHNTVLADYLFTLPAVVLQPLTGAWLIWKGGYNWTDTWLVWTYALYLLAGLCWIPVVWIQIQLRTILNEIRENDTSLPPKYQKLFNIWFILGWPAFISLILIFFLMVYKPA
ncbi:MAG: DUF2269 domain-containing protein [Pseudomonadota bacterium]